MGDRPLHRNHEDPQRDPPPTVDDYKNVILNTNLVDENQVLQLTRLLDRVPYPYIGIGHQKGQHYRLKPMTNLLEVQEDLR